MGNEPLTNTAHSNIFTCLTMFYFYVMLWLAFTWSPYPWSRVKITPVLTVITTFCGDYPYLYYFYVPWLIMTPQWVTTLQWMPNCGFTMGNDIARDIHCDVTMGNGVAMCTYHGITMNNDVAMNIFCYV